MANYQGIECYGGPIGVNANGQRVSGYIQVPENIPHYYLELPGDPRQSKLQVVSKPNEIPDPPKEFRAPNFHQERKSATDDAEVKAAFAQISQGLETLKTRLAFIGPPVQEPPPGK
jgi:hypothetical protein